MKAYYLTHGVSFTDSRFSSSLSDPHVAHRVPFSYQTTTSANGHTITTMWRSLRPNKEDRIAKLEWAPNGGLGRVMMGKVCGFFFSLH